MRSRHRVLLALTLAALALAVAVTVGGGSKGPSGALTQAQSPSRTPSSGFDGAPLPGAAAAPGFELVDQRGRRVSPSSLRGRVVILAFLSCVSRATAPLIAQQIRGALDELSPSGSPPEVAAVAVSTDPASDTRACVRSFLRKTSLTGRLDYLTGTPGRLRAVWRAYGVVPTSAGEAAYERSAFVLLLDRTGARRVEFPLEELSPEGLAHDVRRLWREGP